MKEKYRDNEYAFILSNDYDKISKLIHKYMAGVRIPCKYCSKAFKNKKTLNSHYKVIHRIEKKSNFDISTNIKMLEKSSINRQLGIIYYLTS